LYRRSFLEFWLGRKPEAASVLRILQKKAMPVRAGVFQPEGRTYKLGEQTSTVFAFAFPKVKGFGFRHSIRERPEGSGSSLTHSSRLPR